jgi:Uma2 family endonuclease
MSAAPRNPIGLSYAGLRMSADQYLAIGETPDRYELVNGVVLMSPSGTPDHSDVFLEVSHQLQVFARKTGAIHVYAETDVRFAPDTVYRPDLCVYRKQRLPAKPARLTEPPDLIVEVLSPGTKQYDLLTKRDDYDRFGVSEYWAIDPEDGTVRCWVRESGRLVPKPVTGDSIASTALPGFALHIDEFRPKS